MSKPAKDTIITAVSIITLGVIYYFIVKYTSFGIPCLFHEITGLKCPGCGLSHMFIDLFHFRFKEAFNDNQLMFFLWPFTFGEILYIRYLTSAGRDLPRLNKLFLYSAVGIAMIYCIIRNAELL